MEDAFCGRQPGRIALGGWMMLAKVRSTYHEFPLKFWVLVVAAFIDRIGATLVFPFFSLYVTSRFQVGMTQAGLLLGIFSVSGLLGNMVGGALADKTGRRSMVLFGLVFSALSSVSMGLVDDLSLFYLLAVVVGSISSIGGPARQAMVADLLPEEQRAEGFGILRVAGNLAWIIGPTLGGMLAVHGYLLLFVLDAVSSIITAVIVFKLVPETKPAAPQERSQGTILNTLAGYRHVVRDRLYMSFLLTLLLSLLVYQQMYGTLSVYLRDVHGVAARGYGLLVSINAGTVVLLQFWVTRQTKRQSPLLMMAAGSFCYLLGFTMYGFVSAYALFVLAMLFITFGEMISMPVEQAIVARLAPESMRGRYMAVHALAWRIPATVGPWAAGVVMDRYDPNWVWYLGGIFCAVAITGFGLLHMRTRPAPEVTPEQEVLALP
jgi:MFS family permease